jgi:hypothetical protein
MLAAEHAAQLITSVAALDRAVEQASAAIAALQQEAIDGEAGVWLPGIGRSLARIQLECADVRFAARALRNALPSSPTLQPRLL